VESMKDILKERMVNRSSKETFRFTLTCSVCKNEWHSTPIDSNAVAGYEEARSQAFEEAAETFAACRLCGNPACENCQVSLGEMTICNSCLKRMDP